MLLYVMMGEGATQESAALRRSYHHIINRFMLLYVMMGEGATQKSAASRRSYHHKLKSGGSGLLNARC